jgi:hypothetical protein
MDQPIERRKMNMGRSTWSIERGLLVLTFVFTVLGFTFSVGVTWARLTATEAAIKVLQEQTVPREVYRAEQQALANSIDRLAVAIDRMQQEGLRTPSP